MLGSMLFALSNRSDGLKRLLRSSKRYLTDVAPTVARALIGPPSVEADVPNTTPIGPALHSRRRQWRRDPCTGSTFGCKRSGHAISDTCEAFVLVAFGLDWPSP